ncbi:phage terminase, small subunit, putative, P27 family [Singulisphaera sp. GP187]|uniref:P27 family phage terminase small subunit n=1 Tax=Singulisphaera sp. GP187 TaxID=1882752 RepID=UPI000926795D|nr:P27 family phage terminase small subunit [Singulisphaera sp. GP187]SIO60172.1 phage terminase, small subunit, putative, P27 family [Singulisphaera sp. GP187]
MAKRGRKAAPSPVVPDEIEAPATLNAAEVREFQRLVGACREAGTLVKADVRLIEATARTVCLLERAHDELSQVGAPDKDAAQPASKLTLFAANGTPMPHPLLGIISAQTMRLRGLLKDLGLTPGLSAKSRGGSNGKPEGDGRWGDLLSVTG